MLKFMEKDVTCSNWHAKYLTNWISLYIKIIIGYSNIIIASAAAAAGHMPF